MILKTDQEFVLIEEGIGQLGSVTIATEDPEKNPMALHYILSQVYLGEFLAAREQARNSDSTLLRGQPCICCVDGESKRVMLHPVPYRDGYWFKARYYPPMKETP